MNDANLTDARQILTVSELNRTAREILEDIFPLIWVEGEISNLSTPSSGHIYFSLKDDQAQIRCAFFRNKQTRFTVKLEHGMQVLVRGGISLYEGRGDFQLIIEYLEEAGSGKLQKAFELLKQKLATEGLFDPKYKKALPSLPKQIGIITSATGAAVHDILSILKRRFPLIPVVIYPTQVQGELAAGQIVKAINIANSRAECDVLIVTRGGGSLEDLWPFNEEIVARAIFNSVIPIISAVGHEIDFTIADFVADVRAPTPSAAAEMISPDQFIWQKQLAQQQQQFIFLINSILQQKKQNLLHLQKRLRHPRDLLQHQMQRLDYIEQKLLRAMDLVITRYNTQLQHAISFIEKYTISNTLQLQYKHLQLVADRIMRSMQQLLLQKTQQLQAAMRALDAISPLATLKRGYAIVSEEKTAKIVHSIQDLRVGQLIDTKLIDGSFQCEIKKIND